MCTCTRGAAPGIAASAPEFGTLRVSGASLRRGIAEPRLYTPELRPLTPETTLGFKCAAFAREVLHFEPDPWQEVFWNRALELKPDGSFRFRTVLLLIARQNGKTTAVRVMILWLLFTERISLAVSTAQNLGIAQRSWEEGCSMAEGSDLLIPLIDKVRRANGTQALMTKAGGEWTIKATTMDAARGVAGVDFLALDELRTHKDSGAWGALTKTTMARPNAIILAMTNAGSDESVVLNSLREAALAGGSESLGIFEWSAPDGCALDDADAIAAANPSLGYGRLTMAAINDARAVDPPAVYRTEVLCQRVSSLDSAVDLAAWQTGLDPGDLSEWRGKIAACVDVSLDGSHVSLYGAANVGEGRVRVEPIAAWRTTDQARDELDVILDKLEPYALAWYPGGPASALAPILNSRKNVHELSGRDVAAACMGFADLAKSGRVLHSADVLLDIQLGRATRLHSGDGWRFGRRLTDQGRNVDAVYAAAGACYAALTVAPPKPRRKRVILSD